MTTTYWSGNAQTITQQDDVVVTAVAIGGTLSAVINQKSITYTCVTGDTIATAAAAWLALLSNQAVAPPEFNELTWSSPAAGAIRATASTPGTPFTLSKSQAGGATCTLTHTVANSSPSDVGLAANWLRSGAQSLPQNTDDVVIADSSVPLLWNLQALAAVQFNSLTRWQSFTGTIGLPENNPNGYLEYRPTYFQFSGPGTNIIITLGFGQSGSGPTRERYDAQTQLCTFNVIAAGSPQDDFAIRILGTNDNIYNVTGTSVAIAMLPGETSTLNQAFVYNGGSLSLGPLVTWTGAGPKQLNVNNASAVVNSAPATLQASNSSTVIVSSKGGTYATVNAYSGSTLSWLSNSNITTLTLQTSSTFDKSSDNRSITVANSTIDGDTCLISDPLNTITFTNATTINNSITTGPIQVGTGRTVKVT